MKNIPFKSVDTLPTPKNIDAPMIFLLDFHPIYGGNPNGAIRFLSKGGNPINYSFTPMTDSKTIQWKNWITSDGYEDCEFGYGTVSAFHVPTNTTYSWKVSFEHDGDRTKEFWGGKFELMEDE